MTASTKLPHGYCHEACGIQKVVLKKKAGDSKYVVIIKKMMNIGYQTVSRVNEFINPRGPAPKIIRPLSGYNFFFKYARIQILHSHNLDVNDIFLQRWHLYRPLRNISILTTHTRRIKWTRKAGTTKRHTRKLGLLHY